ncbi:MAG: BON domain-containing protein [Candidatus Melainabacteria bacterium]|nr:BON domain-containing protein [Candidatus Melainabacteria bacterium]
MRSLLACAGACALLLISVNTAQAKAVKADNTKQNIGALEENAVVADKQGNGKEQIKILANIRKVIMKQKDLSMDAKNIKILVSDSNFAVLRGPVNSVVEKERIEELVKSCSGVKGIKTQLSVAAKPH